MDHLTLLDLIKANLSYCFANARHMDPHSPEVGEYRYATREIHGNILSVVTTSVGSGDANEVDESLFGKNFVEDAGHFIDASLKNIEVLRSREIDERNLQHLEQVATATSEMLKGMQLFVPKETEDRAPA